MGIELIGMLKRHEGVRSHAYKCSEKYDHRGRRAQHRRKRRSWVI